MKKPTATSKPKVGSGDVVVVPFPYADKLAEKRRPALVVSGNAFHARQSLVWVVMITSAENRNWPDDVLFPLKGTGLSSASIIRPVKMATIESSRILQVIGEIDDAAAAKVLKAIGQVFAGTPIKVTR